MSTFVATVVMLLAATLCGGLVRFVPLPLPALQIVAGILLSSLFGLHIELDPELFLLVFVAPLLFVDGWRMPKRAFAESRGTILMLAFGLVVFTVVGIGELLHLAVPMIPLAVAFAIAAALSPTDAVALGGITRRNPLPTRMRHILEGEALMNDASGLVSMQVAVAAALTGSFSVGHAALTMGHVAFGGLVIGTLIAVLASRLQRWLIGDHHEQTAPQILLHLMIPFAAYHYSEVAHCSGILAAVAAGMAMPRLELRSEREGAARLQTSVVFEMIGYALNGLIFVLLGMQIPNIFAAAPSAAREVGLEHWWQLLALVVGTFISLVALRYTWTWASLWSGLRRRRLRLTHSHKRAAMIFSVAGVRGAVSLAAMLTLPLVGANGAPFPGRGLALFLGSGVILLSLLFASIALPIWLRHDLPADMSESDSIPAEERRTRHRLMGIAVVHLETQQAQATEGDTQHRACERVLETYRTRQSAVDDQDETTVEARALNAAVRELKLAAIRAERTALLAMRARREVDEEIYERIMRELDTTELAMMTLAA